ncbi:MAG: TonB-dependent receptor [Proteobacteria bacterium]|nr:TonB-dependent receptor [Pseudomonadota bacterium]
MARVFLQALLPGSRAFIFALLVALPCLTSAQDPESVMPEVGPPPADIGVVTVTDDADSSTPEAPGAFTTVIRPSHYGRRAKTASELLSQTVGVDVTNLGGEGALSTVSIRGSSAEQVAVFVDGVRVNSSLTGTFDFSSIPMESIERIEVIRGASSARFGSDAIGGAINIVTKRASAARAIEAKVTGGSYLTLRTSESWREPREGWDLVLAHNHRSTGGEFTFTSAGITLDGGSIADPRTYRRLHNESMSEDVLAKVSFQLPRDTSISISNDFYWSDRDVPGMEIETTLLYPANPLEAHEEFIRDTAGVRFNADDLGVRGLAFEAGASNLVSSDRYTDPSPAIGDPIDATYLALSPGAHLLVTHDAHPGPVHLNSVLRYEYDYDYARDSSPLAGRPLMGPHDRHTNAAFAEIDAGFLDQRLRIVPSARVEAATGRETRASWRVSAIGRPAGFVEVRANAGTAFRYPTFAELYWPDQGYLRGNPDLADERSFGWDAGVAITPPKTRIEVAFFQNYIEDQIIFVPISAFTIQPLNTSRVKSQGIEASLSFEPWEWLGIFANYSWLDAKFRASGLALPGRPSHKANARVEGKCKPMTLFGEFKYVGSYPLNMANTLYLSARATLDLGATLEFARHFFATFEVKDVTNVQTYDAVGFPLPRRSYWMTVGAKT